MSDSIQRDPRVVYANALKEKGILGSWTYNYKGIVVLPEVTPSQYPEGRIPKCVEYMNDDELMDAFIRASANVIQLEEKLDNNFKNMTYSLGKSRDNFLVTMMTSTCAFVTNKFAPLSVTPFQYVFGGFSLVLGGITAYWLRSHFKEASTREQNHIASQVAWNNLLICEGELERRNISFEEACPS
jgi:hypothetical protein